MSNREKISECLPATLAPKDIPPVWQSPYGGYRTPAYYLGWRLTCNQLSQLLDPQNDEDIDISDLMYEYILPRWAELGYDEQFNPNAQPGMVLGPINHGIWDQEVIIFAFSNMSKRTIAASQDPHAEKIIEAIEATLNLSDELANGLGWHTYSQRSRRRKD